MRSAAVTPALHFFGGPIGDLPALEIFHPFFRIKQPILPKHHKRTGPLTGKCYATQRANRTGVCFVFTFREIAVPIRDHESAGDVRKPCLVSDVPRLV